MLSHDASCMMKENIPRRFRWGVTLQVFYPIFSNEKFMFPQFPVGRGGGD